MLNLFEIASKSGYTSSMSLSEIQTYLEDHKADLIDLIKRLAAVESPSTRAETQAGVQEIFREELQRLGYSSEIIPGEKYGGIFVSRPDNLAEDAPIQLMVGHTDTVWPIGTLEKMPIVVETDENGREKMRGPGVFDMKTGDAQMVFALKALQAVGIEPKIKPVIILNSDEEVGSLESRGFIGSMAKKAERAFVLEPAKDLNGKIKTARKGVGKFMIVARGKAAHAGLDPTKGASAVVAMANVIQQLIPLTDLEKGVTVNPGVIEGGTRPNVIAAECRLHVDVRVPSLSDAEELDEAIRAITSGVDGVTLEIEGMVGPPMERTPRNQALWHKAQAIGKEMGVEFEQGYVGGGSDGNTTSLYTATLDGLGAVGDGAHATHEFIYLDKLVERTTLLAALLLSE